MLMNAIAWVDGSEVHSYYYVTINKQKGYFVARQCFFSFKL